MPISSSRSWNAWLVLAILTLGGLYSSIAQAQSSSLTWGNTAQQALPAEQAFQHIIATSERSVLIRLQPADGYYLYRNSIQVVWEDGTQAPLEFLTDSVPYRDEHFGEVPVFFEPVDISIHVDARQRPFTIRFQGCQDNGICYPPMRRLWQPASETSARASEQTGQITSLSELETLLANASQPVLLSFYADWCSSCQRMKRDTFSNPVVRSTLQQFEHVQVDMTNFTDEHQALLDHFGLVGPPAYLLFYSGVEAESLRLLGHEDPTSFNRRLYGMLAE